MPMSNDLAIAAVTLTLQNLLYRCWRDDSIRTSVTAVSPDRARDQQTGNQVNVFLYHAQPDLAHCNRHPQLQVRRGETRKPPLALELHYLITAYGERDRDEIGHCLLGRTLRFLHDCRSLSPADIEMATAEELSDSDLHEQVESIEIAPLFLSFEEMSRLWQGLQAPQRPAVACRISAVLLDSQLPLSVPLPVLTYAARNGRGNVLQKGVLPSLVALRLPHRQPSAQLGDTIALQGRNLDGDSAIVRLAPARSGETINLEPLPGRTGQVLQFALPSHRDSERWVCGVYAVSLFDPARNWHSNVLSFALAPCLRDVTPREVEPGDVTLNLSCIPPLRRRQKAILLWGDRGFPTRKRGGSDTATALTCRIRGARPGEHVLRLRVDGIDSLPVDASTIPWTYDSAQRVRVRDWPEET